MHQVPVKRAGRDTVRENLVAHSLKFIKIEILAEVFTGILVQNKNENPNFSTDLFF